MKEIYSNCKNKKGNVTKEYCLSNPLNPEYEVFLVPASLILGFTTYSINN